MAPSNFDKFVTAVKWTGICALGAALVGAAIANGTMTEDAAYAYGAGAGTVFGGAVPAAVAAWFLFLHMLGQVGSAVRGDDRLQDNSGSEAEERQPEEASDWAMYYYHRCLALEGDLRCPVCNAEQSTVAGYRAHLEDDKQRWDAGEFGPEETARLVAAFAMWPTWFRMIDEAPPEKGAKDA